MRLGVVIKKLSAGKKVLLENFFNFFPIKKNTVMFFSFNGQYNDNPKYISECLHKTDNSIKIIWAMNKQSLGTQPDYVKVVMVNTIMYYYYSSVAQVFVDNYTGKHTFRGNKKLNFFIKRLKRKNQFNLSTWHGTPLKKIHNDIVGASISPEGCFTTCDIFISGNKYQSNIISKNLCHKINILDIGSPRNDIIVKCTNKEVCKLKEKLGIPYDDKIVLFAPTFRDSILDSGINQMAILNIEKLLDTLKSRFGGKWRLALRTHPGVFDKLSEKFKDFFENDLIIDANQNSDMAEYLVISDVLITDYSGSLFDYCLLNRPCFLFAHDLENYSKNERGFYLDVEELPFTFSQTLEELLLNIKTYDFELEQEKIEKFLKYIGCCEKGNASELATEIIIKKLK